MTFGTPARVDPGHQSLDGYNDEGAFGVLCQRYVDGITGFEINPVHQFRCAASLWRLLMRK